MNAVLRRLVYGGVTLVILNEKWEVAGDVAGGSVLRWNETESFRLLLYSKIGDQRAGFRVSLLPGLDLVPVHRADAPSSCVMLQLLWLAKAREPRGHRKFSVHDLTCFETA